MMVKCIALDLDGTALLDDSQLSNRTKAAIERATAQGVHVVVASGRCLESLPESVLAIGGIEYAITTNGAAVYNLKTGECLRRFCLSPQAVERILALSAPEFCSFEAFLDGKAYADTAYLQAPQDYGVHPDVVSYIRASRHEVPDIRQFLLAHPGQLDGFDLLTADREAYARLSSAIRGTVEGVYVTASVPYRIEILSSHAGKHAGLRFLLGHLGVAPEEAASFGNADNDIDMIRTTKYGIAVRNSTPGCLQAAWKVVPSNQEDGVAVGIEELLTL